MYNVIDDVLLSEFQETDLVQHISKEIARYVEEQTILYSKENGGYKTNTIDYQKEDTVFHYLWTAIFNNQEIKEILDLEEYEGSLHANFMESGTSNGPHCHEQISDKVLLFYPYPVVYDEKDGGQLVVYEGEPNTTTKEGIYFICSEEGLYNPQPISYKFDRAIVMDSDVYHSVNPYYGEGRISVVWDLVKK